MKQFLLSLAIVYSSIVVHAQRTKECFDFDWQFCEEGSTTTQNIQLPHDWSIGKEFDGRLSGSVANLPGGVGIYTKTFFVSKKDKDKIVTILFDGIYSRSDVWINGQHLGFRPYGFGYIDYDLTPYIIYGDDNEIKVRVNNPNGHEDVARWYTGCGINRHAWLIKTNKQHLDLYCNAIVANVDGTVNVKTSYESQGKNMKVKYTITDPQGKVVVKDGSSTMKVANPLFWDIDSPHLYTLTTRLYSNGKLVDETSERFGFRTAEFTSDQGFLLNGRRVKLQGFCLHQDDACLGAALPRRSMERKLQKFKEFGCNAVRCSHNQPAPEFLDLCDELGLVVIDEAFDKWKSGYYAEYFDEWWQHDLENMLMRDRNHPSVVLWSIGNELKEAWNADNEGVERARMLQDFVHRFDPTRQVCLACQNNHQDHFAGVTDVVGYNYQEQRMLSDHKKFPERLFVVTEQLPYYQGAEGNIRSYDTDNPWNVIADNDFIAGGFLWTGTDYIGEASWPSHGWPGGLMDIALNEKPRAMFLKAMWNPDRPMVGIAVKDNALNIDHGRDLWQWPPMAAIWNFPKSYEGLVMEVNTITNCERVVLFLNGKKMGDKRTADFKNHTIVWNVPFTPGEIHACGINGSDTVACYRIKTAGEPVKLIAEADRTSLNADGQDLCYVQMELLDKDGTLVQHIDRRVSGTVKGEGRLMGLINTNLVRTTPFTSTSDMTYFGRCFAIIQTTRTPGPIELTLDVEGLAAPVKVLLSSH